MGETKQAYRIGENGKLYFKYNSGAVYQVAPEVGNPFTYKILSCEFEDETGKEYYYIESAGKELSARFSVSRVDLMLSQFPCGQTAAGEPEEIPLLLDEVREFYDKKRREFAKANIAENKKLKGTDWNKDMQTRKKVIEELNYARALGSAVLVAQYEKQLAEVEADMKKLLSDNKVDLKILTKKSDCTVCGDFGIAGGKICACAIERTAAIKSYCALKRLENLT